MPIWFLDCRFATYCPLRPGREGGEGEGEIKRVNLLIRSASDQSMTFYDPSRHPHSRPLPQLPPLQPVAREATERRLPAVGKKGGRKGWDKQAVPILRRNESRASGPTLGLIVIVRTKCTDEESPGGKGKPTGSYYHVVRVTGAVCRTLMRRDECNLGFIPHLLQSGATTGGLSSMLLYVHRHRKDYCIRDREPRTATSTFTQLLSSDIQTLRLNVSLRPQRH